MSIRTLAAVLLLLAVALALLLLPQAPEAVLAGGYQAAGVEEDEPVPAFLERLPEEERRDVEVPAGAVLPSRGGLRGTEQLASAPRGKQVIVRVKVELADGTPAPFAGTEAEAQSWIEKTGDTFRHFAEMDSEGVATFVFPGFVHIDWVKYEPPRDSGLAFEMEEDHIDLAPGTIHTETLALGPAARMHGRVVQLGGRPAPGAEVHVYAGEPWNELADWNPGISETVTDAAGRFEFANLPPGQWGVVVAPFDWLQIDPDLEHPRAGRARFEFEAGDDVDAGDLVVTALHQFEISVVDAAGRPAESLRLRLEPLAFRSPFLRLHGEKAGKPDEMELWIREQSAPPAAAEPAGAVWPYGPLNWRTDAEGRVQAFAAPGSWELTLRPNISNHFERDIIFRKTLSVPCQDQQVRLPAAIPQLAGMVLSLDDQPLSGARAGLTRTSQGRPRTLSDTTDEEGRFAFESLASDGAYKLVVSRRGYATVQLDVAPAPAAAPLEVRLRPADPLRVHAVDLDGKPLRGLKLQILSGAPDLGAVPLRAEEAAWWPREMQDSGRRKTNSGGRLDFRGLLPGTYEVGLMLPFATGGSDSRGRPLTEERAYQTWSLAVQPEAHLLVVDLSGYPDPKPGNARHLGRVRDALTGAAVGGATVRLRNPYGTSSGRTDQNGEFAIGARLGPTSLQVYKSGYLPLQLAAQDLDGPGNFDLALEPGGQELVVHIQDRDGGPLPDLHVALSNARGERVTARVVDGARERGWSSRATAREGKLHLRGLPPGELKLQIWAWSYEFGRAGVEVGAGGGVQEETLRLAESVDELRARIEQIRNERKGGR